MVKKIVGVGILSATLLFGITGCDIKVGKMDYEEYRTGMYVGETEVVELPEGGVESKSYGENIKKLDIELDAGIIEIAKAKNNEFKVDIGKNEKIKIENKGDNLKIYNEGKSIGLASGAIGENRKIRVTIPEKSNINMDLKLGAGIVSFDGIKANEVNVVNGMGVVGSRGIVDIDKVNVTQGAGAITFSMEEVKSITTNQELGASAVVGESITGTIEQKIKMGSIIVQYVKGNPNIKTSLKFGETMLPETVNETGKTKIGNIDLKNNMGLIDAGSISKKEFEDFLKTGGLESLGNVPGLNIGDESIQFEMNIG